MAPAGRPPGAPFLGLRRSDRTERLVRIYNDTYNNLRPCLFDGGHLDFPGMNQATLRPHQKDASAA